MKSGNSTVRRTGAGSGPDTEFLGVLGGEMDFLKSASGEQVFDFIEDMPVGMLLFDDKDRLVRCNKKALEVTGEMPPPMSQEDVSRTSFEAR